MLVFLANLARKFDELSVVFIKIYQRSLNKKTQYQTKNITLQYKIDLIKKANWDWCWLMEYKEVYFWKTTNTCDFICIKYTQSRGPIFKVFHTTVYYEKLHSLTVKKYIIWYTFLIILDRVFSDLFGANFNPQTFRLLKLIWSCSFFRYLRCVWGSCEVWKHSSYTLQLLLRAPLKAKYLCITVGIGPIESKVLIHKSCCWRLVWKQSTSTFTVGPLWIQDSMTLELLLGAPLKA